MRRHALMLAAVIISTAIGSAGCGRTAEIRYRQEPLPLPSRPALPALSAGEMECLSDDAYARLVRRDLQRRQYAEELEAIIRATHGSR